MNIEQFDFELPEELIAQTPLEKRDTSKLLVLDKKTGEIEHKHFTDIIDYLESGDTLVLNDTKVIPARLYGVKEETKALIEILLLKEVKKDTWECLVKPAKRIHVGEIVKFSDKLSAQCTEVKDEGIRVFKLIYKGILYEILDELGEMPLPPYIHEKLKDKELKNSLRELKELYETMNMKQQDLFDLACVPNMEYYTGIIFKVYSKYVEEPIISGGRYDIVILVKMYQQ